MEDEKGRPKRVRMAEEPLAGPSIVKERSPSYISRILVKIVEIILAIFIIGLVVDPLNQLERMHYKYYQKFVDDRIIFITVPGYLIINLLFTISYSLGDRIPKRTSIMFSSVGCILHVVAVGIIVQNFRYGTHRSRPDYANEIYLSKQYSDMLISAAVFTSVNALVFGFDIFVTMKNT